MGVITGYPDDATTSGDDKFLTSDSSGATKLTTGNTLKDFILADGNVTTQKIADSSVTAAKLATSAITLGYAERTSNFSTTSTSVVPVTDLSVSVTIPAGGRRVKITCWATEAYSASIANASVQISLWDGAVGTGTKLCHVNAFGSGSTGATGVTVISVKTPAAGSKTYNVGLLQTAAGTSVMSASATTPSFILVEAI